MIISGYEPDGQTELAIAKLRDASATEQPFALFFSLGTLHGSWGPDNVPVEYLAMFADQDFTLSPNYKPENGPYCSH